MFEVFQYAFMQRAFIGGILAALLISILGVFMVLRRMSLLSDGLAHLTFGGIAAGLLFQINPLITGTIASVLGVFGIQKLKEKRVYGDAAIGILFSLGLAVGVMLISFSGGFNVDLFSFLFGSILSITNTDLLTISALTITSGILLYAFYKELFYITLNEESARVSGLPVEKLNLLLMVLMALVVVSAIKIVGILLVTSLAVIPASSALLLRKSFKKTLAYSALFSVTSVIIGLLASYYFNLAASGAIVFIAILIFLAVLVYKK